MGRGPKIKPDVRKYIMGRALDKKDLKMKAEDLAKKVERELLTKKKKPPARSTMTKIITKTRHREPSPEDQPWHMGTWKDYPLTVQSLAAVIEAYRFAAQRDATLTIRQAKWIGRLCAVPKRMFPELGDKELLHLLIFWALQYASAEMSSEVSGEPFVTTYLDYWLWTEYPPPPHGGYRFEAMAAHSLKAQASHDAPRRLREWLKEPVNQERVRRRKEIGAILQNPRLAKDPELGDRLESLVREDTQNL